MKVKSKLLNNTVMMYVMTIAKLVIPLISLPYLTRVLTVDCYGSISFVKSIMTYFQVAIDFGFLLSATKDIINAIKKKETTNKVIGNVLYSQLIICIACAVVLVIMLMFFDILKGYELYAILSLIVCFLTIFLFEYVFKAYENMQKIAIRYILMKVISLLLTLAFVKSDKQVILMPIFDIIASLIAIYMVKIQLNKMEIKVDFSFRRIKEALHELKISFVYFISNFATTAFTALNTVLIGLALTKSDVAYWTVTMQIVSVVQALYNPIITSSHPAMLKKKNLNIIHKVMFIYVPIILMGCAFIIFFGDWAVTLVFSNKYLKSSQILKYMIPVLILSFPAMMYGWPALDAIDKAKAATISTIVSAVVQVLGIVLLFCIDSLDLVSIAIVRGVSELTLCSIRMGICYKNKKLFVKDFTNDLDKEIETN